MINFRCFLIFIFLLCSFLSPLSVAGEKNKAFRTIWHPTFLGERLDYCTADGAICGKEVANRFCKMLGYEYSSQNVMAHNVGLTNFLASRVQCKGWRCNGFMTISCATTLSHKPPKSYHYREKRYANPRFNDYRLDWCYDKNKGCGARAANSFCSRMGYMRAKTYAKETQIGATKSIGSQELCFGNQCNGFKMIICSR